MKRLGLILGAAFYVFGGASPGPSSLLEPRAASAAEESAGAPAAAGAAADPIYVDLAPMVLPVIDGDRVQQVLQFTITVQVADQKSADHIRSVGPRLTDAYIQDLYGALDRHRVLDGKVVDVERLRDELTKVSTGILGENAFQEILIQRISQRMM
jgi:flagellar protein FliL